MAMRQLAWLLRQRTRTVWVLAFIVLIAQPAWGYSAAAANLPARFPPMNTVSVLGSAVSDFAALPTWFTAAEQAQTQRISVDDRLLALPAEPLPEWFYSVRQPRPAFQLSPSLTKATLTPNPTLGQVYTYTILFTIPAGLTHG